MPIIQRRLRDMRDNTDPLAEIGTRFMRPTRVAATARASTWMPIRSGRRPATSSIICAIPSRNHWGLARRRSWGEAGWLDAAATLGDGIARIVGAEPGEIVVADSTTINLFKAIVGALHLRPNRTKVVSEAANFPTDLYAAQAAIDLTGGKHNLVLAADGQDSDDDVCALIDSETAVVALSLVDYRTSRRRRHGQDFAAAATDAGALTVWDLSHGAGAVPIDLNADRRRLSPSAAPTSTSAAGPARPPSFLSPPATTTRSTSASRAGSGHADQFAFELGYRPAAGARRALIGTPPVLSTIGLAGRHGHLGRCRRGRSR